MNAIDHVDLNLLRVFQAIIEEGSLTRAGQRLGLSQPAVSYSLGRLRTLFDDPLFIRTRSSMQPTPTALEVSAIVSRALETVREAFRYAERFDPVTSSRTFRLSLSDAGELGYLPRVCEVLQERAPRVSIQVVPTPIALIGERLRSSRLDCAIGHLPELLMQTESAVLFEEDYVCMCRAKRTGGSTVTKGRIAATALATSHSDGKSTGSIGIMPLADYLRASHVRVNSLEHSHMGIDDALRARRVTRNVALDLSHFASLPAVLAVTDHLATIPRRLAQIFQRSGAFDIFDLPVPLPAVQVTLHWHAHFAADDGNTWFRELITEVVGPAIV
ncbi:LysR family transcriptional regulator [Robbsia andropogonis]|uniref:LysR family transcriptional regulator n=1 Tax=Robbsia andropogonis TaxID=28092 RepID=UPI002A6A389E|nr:LysR family transcriptional regulator [Robbsia andropogonis]